MNTRQQATSRHLRRLSGIMPRSSSGTAPPQQGLAQQPTVRAAGPDAEVAGCVTASLAAAPAADLIGFSAISIPALAGRLAASAEAREARESYSSTAEPRGTPRTNGEESTYGRTVFLLLRTRPLPRITASLTGARDPVACSRAQSTRRLYSAVALLCARRRRCPFA
jgi:hypothetical protein